MATSMIAALLQAARDEDTLTLTEIIADIPHDAAAFVVYAMLAVSGWLIWKANRRTRPPQP